MFTITMLVAFTLLGLFAGDIFDGYFATFARTRAVEAPEAPEAPATMADVYRIAHARGRAQRYTEHDRAWFRRALPATCDHSGRFDLSEVL